MITSDIADALEINCSVSVMSLVIGLTHFPLDKMAAISQMIYSDAFSWMKSFIFW